MLNIYIKPKYLARSYRPYLVSDLSVEYLVVVLGEDLVELQPACQGEGLEVAFVEVASLVAMEAVACWSETCLEVDLRQEELVKPTIL